MSVFSLLGKGLRAFILFYIFSAKDLDLSKLETPRLAVTCPVMYSRCTYRYILTRGKIKFPQGKDL